MKMDLREAGCNAGDWIDLTQDRDHWRAYEREELTSGFVKNNFLVNEYQK